MKHTKLITLIASMAFATGQLAAHCGACGAGGEKDHLAEDTHDIVHTAMEAGSFNTLVAAVKAAGLVETLQGPGPFTVFAPTDEAFAKLPAGTVENLLKPENRDQLIAVLTYHVIPAKVPSSAVKSGAAPTVNGANLKIKVWGGKVKVNDATVVQTDIDCSNGVIHVVDQVILPPAAS